VYGHEAVRQNDHDLTTQHKGRAARRGEHRAWHVLDEDGPAVPTDR